MENVIVKDNLSGEVLFKTSIENAEAAYKEASKLEEMGLDVSIESPSLPETLISSLGADQTDREHLKKEIDDEIDSHNSCCLEKE